MKDNDWKSDGLPYASNKTKLSVELEDGMIYPSVTFHAVLKKGVMKKSDFFVMTSVGSLIPWTRVIKWKFSEKSA